MPDRPSPVAVATEPAAAPGAAHDVDAEIAGLDALELADHRPRLELAARLWRAVWPKLGAGAIVLAVWQLVVALGIWPTYVLPGPATVLAQLGSDIGSGNIGGGLRITMQRALVGYGLALVVGVAVGAPVSRLRVLRTAVGSMITGLQTMPSIAWFPLAILLFKGSEGAIIFVVVLGAAPAIANGLISGADNIPPLLLRAGRVLGARGPRLYWHVVLPASMPSFIAGLKQGWAFAWRSLMAGELIVIVAKQPSIGVQMQTARDLNDTAELMAIMIVIFVVGVVVDSLLFGTLERAMRRRWGLVDRAR